MDTKNINDLHGNELNPRVMSRHDAESLQVSLEELGDLGGIIFNTRLNRLVGGHMRVETFKKMGGDASVVITTRLPEPNRQGTVALGYIKYDGEFYAYREVDWEEARDLAANIAANRISGEWDLEKLANVDELIKQQDESLLLLTGQTEQELKRLEKLSSAPEEPAADDAKPAGLSVKLTESQLETVERALSVMKAKVNFDSEANPDRDGNALYYICANYLTLQADAANQDEFLTQ